MDGVGSHSAEDWLDDGGASDRNPWRRWPARTRDWKQVLLFLLALVAVGLAVYYMGGPPLHHYQRMTPAERQVANRFTTTLLVQGDCAAATALSYPDAWDFVDAPPPRTHNSQRCFSYFDDYFGEGHSWYLVRNSGKVSRHCAIDDLGGKPDRHRDDCLWYLLIARDRDPYSGKLYVSVGYLVVSLLREKHAWRVVYLAPYESGSYPWGQCFGECQEFWSQRSSRL